jgi:hypothetical protein
MGDVGGGHGPWGGLATPNVNPFYNFAGLGWPNHPIGHEGGPRAAKATPSPTEPPF